MSEIGIKQDQLQKCVCCGRGMMHEGSPFFYRVRVEQFVVDLRAVQRQHGLEQMLGSPVLAHVMGTNPDIAKRANDTGERLICSGCALNPDTSLSNFVEAASKAEAA